LPSVVAHEFVHLLHRNRGDGSGRCCHALCRGGGNGRRNWNFGRAGVPGGIGEPDQNDRFLC
jgi:hypothetical protein